MSSLNQVRSLMAQTAYFTIHDFTSTLGSSSALPALTIQGNLLAGAVVSRVCHVFDYRLKCPLTDKDDSWYYVESIYHLKSTL